jgi:hypothetical protein
MAQHVLCLRNKLMEFSYEALEDELRASDLGCFNIEQAHMLSRESLSLRVFYELSKLEQVGRDVLRPFDVLRVRREWWLCHHCEGNHFTP